MMKPRTSTATLDAAVKACTALAATALVCAGIALMLAPAAAADKGSVARGRYLVEQVGMCADCHSARDAKGMIVRETNLRGAPIGFKPLAEMPGADTAPPLAGMPSGWTRAQLVTFLGNGKRPDGSQARPPMPEYRLTRADAAAVADYLASLK
ncbi:MAG: c-type cytochrome [Alsobacter sp.]